jgi:hypothetical protein
MICAGARTCYLLAWILGVQHTMGRGTRPKKGGDTFHNCSCEKHAPKHYFGTAALLSHETSRSRAPVRLINITLLNQEICYHPPANRRHMCSCTHHVCIRNGIPTFVLGPPLHTTYNILVSCSRS